MTPERWQQVQDVFLDAQEYPPAERAAYLDEACADDPELRHEVDELLEAAEEPPTIFHAQAQALAQALGQEAAPSLEGRQIGPYELQEKLGQGGMGAVYLAERSDVGLRVAIKLVRGTLVGTETARRFLLERKVLGRLQHPHIARLLDAGVTEDETPYFVMEYVKGVPLTTYCDRHRLPIHARLELFATVCDAVAHAHRNLIVHRDLKPGNILVEEDEEGQPRVKLLDFGIAKLLDDREIDPELEAITRTGHWVMTPEYAAPEQVRWEPVSTATDVYALGMILYELLTGARAYPVEGATPPEIERSILGARVEAPSRTIHRRLTQGGDLPAVASARRLEPSALARRLEGDLDALCLKALRKDRGERYASAEALLADLRRHQQGLPIEAQRQTASYRTRKFVQRHRVAVVAASLIVLSLIVGMTVASWQAQRARAEREVAEQARDQAEAVTAFMLDMFEASDPRVAQGEEVPVRDVLDRALAQVDQLNAQPEVKSQVLMVIGGILKQLGSLDRSAQLLERALSTRLDVYGPQHPDVATSLEALGTVRLRQGQFEEAERHLLQALSMRESLFDSPAEPVAQSLHALAQLDQAVGRTSEAAARYQQAVRLFQATVGDTDEQTLAAQSDWAGLYFQQRAYARADSLYRLVVETRRDQTVTVHPRLARDLNNLALLRTREGDLAVAESLHAEVLAMRQKLYPSPHSLTAESLQNLANTRARQQAFDDAYALHSEALSIRRVLLGSRHPDVAESLHNLGLVLTQQRRYSAADSALVEALRIREARLGTAHPATVSTLVGLGRLRRDEGGYEASAAWYEDAIRRLGTRSPLPMERIQSVCDEYTRLYLMQGRLADLPACPSEVLAAGAQGTLSTP